MYLSLARFLALWGFAQVACAAAVDVAKEPVLTAQQSACAGIANEGLKLRELRREVGMYFDKPLPEDLERRVKHHLDTAASLKAECTEQRARSMQAK